MQRALDHALARRSALVIAHRLYTVRHADQILVVDDGTVVERGTHHELVAAGGLYSELYRTQFAEQGSVAEGDVVDDTMLEEPTSPCRDRTRTEPPRGDAQPAGADTPNRSRHRKTCPGATGGRGSRRRCRLARRRPHVRA